VAWVGSGYRISPSTIDGRGEKPRLAWQDRFAEVGLSRIVDEYTKIEHMLQTLQFMSIKQRLYFRDSNSNHET